MTTDTSRSRREFLSDIGKGMLVATLGPAIATEFGLPQTFADDSSKKLKTLSLLRTGDWVAASVLAPWQAATRSAAHSRHARPCF